MSNRIPVHFARKSLITRERIRHIWGNFCCFFFKEKKLHLIRTVWIRITFDSFLSTNLRREKRCAKHSSIVVNINRFKSILFIIFLESIQTSGRISVLSVANHLPKSAHTKHICWRIAMSSNIHALNATKNSNKVQ